MNSTLTSQHELTVRPVAPVRSTHVDVALGSVAYQASMRSCTTINPVNVMSTMTWLGGSGSKVNTSVFASKRPTTRPLAEALT